MALLASLLKQTIGLRKTIDNVNNRLDKLHLRKDAYAKQKKVLRKLLRKAQFTEFGKHYHFSSIIESGDVIRNFQKNIPAVDYDMIYDRWWHRLLKGEENICWPGKVKYFALSSGTSGAASKYIPVTNSQLNILRRTGIKQISALTYFDLPEEIFTKGWLMIGGSTDLRKNAGGFEGDLSGITTSHLPHWFQSFYRPGIDISKEKDWNTKIDRMVKNAKTWDIAFIAGVPSWVQMLFEKIIEFYKVKTIHEVWPNLSVYLHGGVTFEPYRASFDKLLAKPLTYIETYLASEGFVAYQSRPHTKGMQLVLSDGIFYEFIPFNEKNFDVDGKMVERPEILSIKQAEENKEYALLITTSAGAWRYLIGDTIKFINLERNEIIITGRTKHFLSLCGEHLSVDNMTKALQICAQKLKISIPEFTVSGKIINDNFAHQWYIGTNDRIDADHFKKELDDNLKLINDDYAVERNAALKVIQIEIIPLNVFYEYMQKIGKLGAQSKFPRVLKGDKLKDWENFVLNRKV